MEHLVSNSIHHPGKVRFLLEWQSAVLLHKKGGASNADNDEWDFCISLLLTRMNGNLIQNDRLPPIAQTPCWTFMRELLRRVCDEPVLPPLKYPLIPILSQWIRYWLTVEDLNGDRLKTFEEQLGLVLDCWTLLSEKLHRYLLATVDQTLQLSSDVLDLFTQVMQLQSVLTKTAFLFKGVWTYFLDYVTKQGNLKKMFSFTAETTLGPILFIYAQLSQAPSTSLDSSTVTSIRALCEAYISKTLFHADHIKEIGLPLKGRVSLDESTVPFTKNYTSVLLDQLVKLAEKKSLLWETQVQGLPFLLKQLITSLPPVTDKVPQQTALVFSFFQFLDGLLSVSNATFDSQEVLHKTRYDMLLLLSQNSIYRPTNDSLSKEQSLHLEKLANNLLLVNTHKAHVWKTWSILLRMDYMLVESRISELLCDMTNSESEADAMELAQHLMSVFHKSRKLDMFLIHVLDSKATTEKSVFFHSATLQVLAHSVSTSLPAQSMHLFVTLVDYLVDLFEASPSSAAQVKKSKKSSRNEPSYEMVSAVPTVTFLEVVVRHMRVSTGQVQAFSQTSQKIKEKIIEPAFDMLEKASTTKDFANIAAARIVPALRLHYQLMSSFDAYWTDFVTGKEIVKILKKTKKLTDYTAIVEMRVC